MTTLLSWLLRLFPAAFRRHFGGDMLALALDDIDRARDRGRIRAAGAAIATALDLIRSAWAERRHPTRTRFPLPSPQEQDLGMQFSSWTGDLRHAVRSLRRSPGFAAATVATLGLAIGANASIFGIVDAVLLRPLPYPDQDRLMYVVASAPGSDMPEEFGVSREFYIQYKEQSQTLEDVALFNQFTNTLRLEDRTERVWMSAPTPSMFSTLQVSPMLGRLPHSDDENVVVISHTLWTTWFGADPRVLGRSVFTLGNDRTVIGVMGPDFWFPTPDVLLWVPGEIRAEDISPGRFGMPLVARVAPGVEPGAVAEELTTLARRLPERFGGSANYAQMMQEQHRAVVRPVYDQLFGGVQGPLWVLLAAVGIVLVIACANAANLFLVRAEHRQRDLAVRCALGAGRGALIRTQMAEATVLSLAAGVLAVLLAWLGVPVFVAAAPTGVPRLAQAALTAPTLAFTLILTILAALACGLVPAIRAAAPSLTRLRDAGGRGSTRDRTWMRDGLVVSQTALALVLLIGSGLLVRSFLQLRQVDPGYETENVFTFQIAPERADLGTAESYARFSMDFMERLRALPGVESVGLVENVPLNEGLASGRFLTPERAPAGEGTPEAADDAVLLNYTWSAGDYFATMGIDVVQGRPFRDADHTADLGNVVISRTAAEMLWPGENALGRQLRMREREVWFTVVGVVEDVMQYGFRDTPQPLVYLALVAPMENGWRITSPAYVVRTPRAEAIAPEIRALVRELDPIAPMYRVYTMAELASDSMVQLSFTMLTLGTASTLALVLAAIGLFGVLSYVVAGRTREIGVRMALGAEATRVRKMVVAQGARLLAVGVVVGVGGAIASTRVLGSLLFGVAPADPITFAAMSIAMVAVGLLACYLPAARASRVDPLVSLRGE